MTNMGRAWPNGPWTEEPDHEAGLTAAGLPFILHRNQVGCWCGYVGVPEGHPAYGKRYDAVEADVHGGLTYAKECAGPICHEKVDSAPEVWWLGFDCSHYSDLMPGSYGDQGFMSAFGVYRDQVYVRAECERLADQLRSLENV